MRNDLQEANYEPIVPKITFSRKTTLGNASYAYHQHDACEIFLFLSGNIRFYIEHSCFTPAPCSLIIVNPKEMHRVQSMDGSSYERIVINIHQHYMEALSPPDFSLTHCFFSRPLGRNNLCTLSPETLGEFYDIYQGLEKSASENCYGGTVMENAYASLLLLFINRQFQSNTTNYKNSMPPYIMDSMEYIDSHLSEALSLSALSEKFHISGNYLSAQFKLHTGLTLRDYLLDRKVNYAKQLLVQGANVTEACYQAGFNDDKSTYVFISL